MRGPDSGMSSIWLVLMSVMKYSGSSFVVQKVDVSSVAEGATAKVLVCTYDDGVTYDAKHDGPDGKPIAIDDSISSARTAFAYQREGGAWKITGGDVQKTWAGENHCTSKT